MTTGTNVTSINDKEIIAIVDDDESIRKALLRTIVGAGMEVLSFSSAQDLLAATEIERVSCVVSDLRMPGIDGLRLQSALAERMPHVAMVIVTGHGDVPSTVQAMKSGAVDFLEKPVRRADLIEAITRATQRTHRDGSGSNGLEFVEEPIREAYSSRASSLRVGRGRLTQQTDCCRTGERRKNHEATSRGGNGQDASGVGGRSGSDG